MTRRRAALVLCMGAFACSQTTPQTPDRAPLRVALNGADADVWAFDLTVTGAIVGMGAPESCAVRVGARAFAADLDDAHTFRSALTLEPGDNAVQAECQERGRRAARSNVLHYRVRLVAAPRAYARIVQTSVSDSWILDGTQSQPSESTPEPITHYAWYSRASSGTERSLGTGVRLPTPPTASGTTYVLRVIDTLGRSDEARAALRDANAERNAIVYGVLPPLYGSPPLSAATAALADLAELGVDSIWLAPVFGAAHNDYGYAVCDYFKVRPEYGSVADLHAFVARAHELGLRVLLDFPANHSSNTHPYFRQAERLGRASHYFGFFARDGQGAPTHYFDWEKLPNLDYRSSEVMRWMLEVSDHWIKQFDVDGYRLDAAWGVRDRNPEFWPRFASELRRSRPDAMLIAEASARDGYYAPANFSAAYDWTSELGKPSWEHVFDRASGIAKRLSEELHNTEQAEDARAPRVLRFLNNNDTGPRFITRHGADLTRVATAALLTLPGIPCLYAFDEVGAEFEPYAELRPIEHRDPALRAFHRRWIALRRTQPALTAPGLHILYVGARDEALVYLRFDAVSVALVALNFSDRATELAVELPAARWKSTHARDVASGSRIALRTGQLRLRLAAWDARVLVPD
jgi:cyclomaltodextrinase